MGQEVHKPSSKHAAAVLNLDLGVYTSPEACLRCCTARYVQLPHLRDREQAVWASLQCKVNVLTPSGLWKAQTKGWEVWDVAHSHVGCHRPGDL